jgi:hypothetical protein
MFETLPISVASATNASVKPGPLMIDEFTHDVFLSQGSKEGV